jgi:hypothetical protein
VDDPVLMGVLEGGADLAGDCDNAIEILGPTIV